jgi:hypothetical protein
MAFWSRFLRNRYRVVGSRYRSGKEIRSVAPLSGGPDEDRKDQNLLLVCCLPILYDLHAANVHRCGKD